LREKDESSQPEEAGQQGILDQVLAGIVYNEPAKQIEYDAPSRDHGSILREREVPLPPPVMAQAQEES
jgi:hypothetical protein